LHITALCYYIITTARTALSTYYCIADELVYRIIMHACSHVYLFKPINVGYATLRYLTLP
jgi:hypothetical protein